MSKQLHDGQLAILELLYKYRFGSRELIARSLSIKAASVINEKLIVLHKHGYLNKTYDKSFRLLGKPIIYSLTPRGLRALQAQPNNEFIGAKDINQSYRRVSIDFMFKSLQLYNLMLVLQKAYPGLKVFTEPDMRRFSYFPKNKPDALLSLPAASGTPARFYLDFIPAHLPHFAVTKKLLQYAQFFEDGGWDPISSTPPVILLVIERDEDETNLQKRISDKLSRLGFDYLEILINSSRALKENAVSAVWTDILQPDRLVELV